MKKILIVVACSGIISLYFITISKKSEREEYEIFLRSHEYKIALNEGGEHSEENAKPDRPDLAFMQDFLRTMDPILKRPTPEILYEQNIGTANARDRKNSQSARTQATSLAQATVWEERGPSNVAGRTRAMLFDPADATKKKVWAGGVSGGLWFNNDITNAATSWNKVNDFWDNLSISCIAADPNNNQVMYVGTGEFEFFVRGGGIWKTTNGGTTWARLTTTTNFYEIRDIVVRNESGTSVVYAAVNPAFGDDNPVYTGGLYRSADGGSAWTQVLPSVIGGKSNLPTDIEIAADNSLWVGTKAISGSNSTIYQSSTGVAGGWSSKFVSTFTGQIELGTAPSNASLVYAILEDQGAVASILKTINTGVAWSSITEPQDADTNIPAEDFTRGQAWYDLTIAVHPTNANEVIVGGIDLFKTTNGGTTWAQLSKWWPGIAVTAPVVHADQHEILYRPGFPNEAIFGNDGGVYYGNNLNAGTSSASILSRNLDYNVTQFYTGALHPIVKNYMLGGTQDNGTQKFTQPGFGVTAEAYGGDGGACFIDQLNPAFQIVSYVYNDVHLSVDGGATFNIKLLDDANSGNFINNGDYDSNQKILFMAKDATSIYRLKNVTTTHTVGQITIPGLGSIVTAMRGSPFITTQSNLYVGTDAGRVFRIINAQATSPTISEITGAAFPMGTISSIAFGASENQITVTFFNYGVVSIWESRDGGTSWQNKEGNLPNMPVRWVEYHPQNSDQAYIATELGVWSTDNINVASPVWNSTNGGLANVRTDMLRIRKADGTLMASTYGRGVFTATIPAQLEQTITFAALPAKTFGDSPFTISATSTSQLPVVFISSDTMVAAVRNNSITIKGAGTATITATQNGNIYYKAATNVAQSLTIGKALQTITFPALNEKTINDQPFELTAIATSGLAVTYTSSNAGAATISGSKLTIKGVGKTTITGKQSGNNNYLPAADVSQELTIISRIIKLTGPLDFGDVVIGEKDSLNLIVENIGTAPVTISDIGYPSGYSGSVISSVNPVKIKVVFKPLKPEDYIGEITVNSNATSGNNKIAVTGTGISITDIEKYLIEKLLIYPNPANDWITITGYNFGQINNLNLTDQSGRTYSKSVSASDNEIRINIADLSVGVYIISIPINNRLYYKRFTKQ